MILDIILSLRPVMSMWLSRNTTVATILPQRDFGSAAPSSTHRATSMIVLASLAEATFLRSFEQTDRLDNYRGLAGAAVAVGDGFAIGTEVLETMHGVDP